VWPSIRRQSSEHRIYWCLKKAAGRVPSLRGLFATGRGFEGAPSPKPCPGSSLRVRPNHPMTNVQNRRPYGRHGDNSNGARTFVRGVAVPATRQALRGCDAPSAPVLWNGRGRYDCVMAGPVGGRDLWLGCGWGSNSVVQMASFAARAALIRFRSKLQDVGAAGRIGLVVGGDQVECDVGRPAGVIPRR
jgi:hypothetical protein